MCGAGGRGRNDLKELCYKIQAEILYLLMIFAKIYPEIVVDILLLWYLCKQRYRYTHSQFQYCSSVFHDVAVIECVLRIISPAKQ